MTPATIAFNPDYAPPPGWLLEEHLEVAGLSHAEFARRCGRSPKLISEIISAKAPVEPETALQFEKVLGVSARIWLGIEADYQLHKARKAEENAAANQKEWLQSFPLKEMVERNFFSEPVSDVDALSKVLSFFRVGTIEAWSAKYASANVAYRHSPTFKSSDACLATWLRAGELIAEGQDTSDYNEAAFKAALAEIRTLTLAPVNEAMARTRKLCADAGVTVALVKPFPKTALSGAAWWHTPRRPVVQLSARHKTDDHLWFSFFHEAAHIILHSKKTVFVDNGSTDGDAMEAEANAWASHVLVPTASWRRFVASGPRSASAVKEFALDQSIAPGIVVGMLQHHGHLAWSHLNGLKVRLKWADD
ncbi:HigA family addiction module antitoxin [Mesorhizobium marinum]|uniref:HigA family addiction module antitoxin n=1 Tax=Mesorhizobium marinum TaxID=3228790 RepID=UPI0034670332